MHVNPNAELLLEAGDLVVAMGSEEELTVTAALLQ
jgi:K+/H+ antiporter YhaU regulatory subunit KhtT